MPNLVDVPLSGGGLSVADALYKHNFDVRALQPWVEDDEKTYRLTTNKRGEEEMIRNDAGGFLRKGDWEDVDKVVVEESKKRLRGVADLRGKGLERVVPGGGLGKYVTESELVSSFNEASVGMDPTAAGVQERPHFTLHGLPLPVIYKPFEFGIRQLAAAQNGGGSLDMTSVRLATRSVSEAVEKLLMGTASENVFLGLTIAGYTNLTGRQTKNLTNPTTSGWTPETTVKEINAAIDQLYGQNHYGPYAVYFSQDWRTYLENDYKAATGATNQAMTLLDRVKKISDVEVAKILDFLTAKTILIVQLSDEVVRMVIGLDMTVVQWDGMGGLSKHWLVMCILIPDLRLDHAGQTGICHCSYT